MVELSITKDEDALVYKKIGPLKKSMFSCFSSGSDVSTIELDSIVGLLFGGQSVTFLRHRNIAMQTID